MTTKDAIKNFLLKLKSMDESTVSEEVIDAAGCCMTLVFSARTDPEDRPVDQKHGAHVYCIFNDCFHICVFRY